MEIRITRVKRLHGILVPYVLIVDHDVGRLCQLLKKAEVNGDSMLSFQREYAGTEKFLIKNGETVTIETENDSISIFATNGFYDDSPMYPLAISNMLVCAEPSQILLKSSGGWLRRIKLTLEKKDTF